MGTTISRPVYQQLVAMTLIISGMISSVAVAVSVVMLVGPVFTFKSLDYGYWALKIFMTFKDISK